MISTILNHPYYVTPDREIGRQAYVVIREAMKKEGMVALGRVILTTREHVIAIEPHGQGLLGITLRYPYEIRKEADYFGDLQDERVPKEMLDLATHIVATRSRHFRPEKFEDRYERALRELIKRKQRGEKIVKPRERPSATVIDLMEWKHCVKPRQPGVALLESTLSRPLLRTSEGVKADKRAGSKGELIDYR
jgi:DNA end-binding protein Ku